jgi:putative SOS response-associated peptidase YedK
MCGRYALHKHPLLLQVLEGLADDPLFEAWRRGFPARYNIAPTQLAPVVRAKENGDGRRLSELRWGLVPRWSRETVPSAMRINARAESVADKPSFREAFERRPCLVPATGFYEWKRIGRGKEPWFVAREDGEPFCFAGLWERARGPEAEGGALETFTIVTTEANERVRPLHDRMPLVLRGDDLRRWLAGTDERRALLAPSEVPLSLLAVTRRVNDVSNDDAACLTPATGTFGWDV